MSGCEEGVLSNPKACIRCCGVRNVWKVECTEETQPGLGSMSMVNLCSRKHYHHTQEEPKCVVKVQSQTGMNARCAQRDR